MISEIWKDVQGYEGHYQVSNLGRVKSLSRIVKGKGNGSYIISDRILKLFVDKYGYNTITLKKDRKYKCHYIHRLVADAFIPNSNKYPIINHKDENPSNNCADNLEWCTNQYNIEYSCAKSVLCVETGEIYKSLAEAQNKTGIFKQNISLSCLGKRKTAGKYHWKFINNQNI